MNMSFKIFSAFGIPVRLHITMLIVPWFAMRLAPDLGLFGAIAATFILFGSVLLHEFGHSLVARRFGVQTADIVLTPLGGMARIINMTTKPRAEIAIAIAGPLVSLALATAMFFLIPVAVFIPLASVLEIVWLAMWLNLMLGVFNLVPALPMDGGRILRGLLAIKKSHLDATIIAANVSRVLAVGGGLIAIFITQSFFHGAIAFFVFTSAGSEVRMARAMEARRTGQGPNAGSEFPFGFPGRRRRPPSSAAPENQPTNENGSYAPGSRPYRHAPGPVIIEGGKAKIVAKRDPSS